MNSLLSFGLKVLVVSLIALGAFGGGYWYGLSGVERPIELTEEGGRKDAGDFDPFAAPSAASSTEERQAYFKSLGQISRVATTVYLTDCNIHPEVINTKADSPIKLKNDGAEAVTFRVGKDVSETIGSGLSATVKAGFGRGGGLYVFSCQSSSTNGRGIMMVAD